MSNIPRKDRGIAVEAGHVLEDLLIAVEEDQPIGHNTRKLVNKALMDKMLEKKKAEKQKRKREKRILRHAKYVKNKHVPLKRVVNEQGEEEWVKDISLQEHLA